MQNSTVRQEQKNKNDGVERKNREKERERVKPEKMATNMKIEIGRNFEILKLAPHVKCKQSCDKCLDATDISSKRQTIPSLSKASEMS